MKTFAMLLCAFLLVFGMYSFVFLLNAAGVFLMIIGGFSFVIISKSTTKIPGYDARHWMNR